MTQASAWLNIVLGAAYVGIGVITALEMRRDWRLLGFSHFGAAFIAMGFTCGPHHLEHGLHIISTGRSAGAFELGYLLVGIPVAIVWVLLRVEAFHGGRGDRFVSGTPRWLGAAPGAGALLAVVFVAVTFRVLGNARMHVISTVIPNIVLVLVYMTIGYFLLRTQLRNRSGLGGWSVSGCSLGAIFPTCALMHAVVAVHGLSGAYAFSMDAFVIDWLSVPAGLYFLWVVRGLYRHALRDWNSVGQPPAVLVG